MGGIFISYRRSDSQGEAGRLFDDLVKNFGEQTVFMDVSGIEAGRDFRKAIEEGVTKCGVLLVVMGPEWLNAKNESGARRLDDSADFVRIETAAALRRDIPVIPVLVRAAGMPRADQLPEDLKELAYRNCIELTHARWRSDIQLLVDALHRVVGNARAGETGTGPNQTPASARPGIPLQEVKASSKLESASSASIDPAIMQRVSHDLALHIGPIADIVVRRAAARCTSVEDLYLKVAEDIDSRDERQKFLLKCASIAPTPLPDVVLATTPANNTSRALGATSPSKENDVKLVMAPTATGMQPSSRWKYWLLAIGGVVLLIMALVFGKRFAPTSFAPTQGGGTSQTMPTSPRETQVAESAPVETGTPPPAAVTPTQSDEPAQPPGARATGGNGPRSPEAVRVPQDVSLGLLFHKVSPFYPPLARQAHIQGAVLLDAKISKDGTVETLKLINGHPMLVPAAIDAVKQWRFKPYVLHGERVAVNTQIVVNFTLSTR